MTDHGRRVVLDAGSIDLRRELGPTAWVVFEELLLVSSGPVDACQASVSVRVLAGRLGLAKDTVARALGRLRRAGLVTATQTRTASGVFTTGTYRVSVPVSIAFDDCSLPASPASARAGRSQSRSSRVSGSQLALALEA